MTQQLVGLLLDDARLTLDEFASSCTVSREWIIEHVYAGVLLSDYVPDPAQWLFTGRDVLRARRLSRVEHDFEANAELAGLVADLFEELDRLRVRLRRAGLPPD